MARQRIACGMVLLSAIVGCRPEATSDRHYGTVSRHGRPLTTIVVNNFDEPEYLDSTLASDQVSSILISDLFEGLVVKHPRTLEPVQGVAERYDKSEDDRLFRFFLRKEARWSDGRAVVASDFVYAWRRVLTPATGSRSATLLHVVKNGRLFNQNKLMRLREASSLYESAKGKIVQKLAAGTAWQILSRKGDWAEVVEHHDLPYFGKPPPKPLAKPARGFVRAAVLVANPDVIGVRATSSHVLEVQLEDPTPYFLELCSYVVSYPVRRDLIEHFAAKGQEDRWARAENIITNGPYTVDDWRFRYRIVFKRNPHHYDHDQLKIHRIVWLEVPNINATLNLYKTGELDYVGAAMSLPPAHMGRLSAFEDFSRSMYLSTYWYAFNVTKKPVDDPRVRLALNLAVDKRQLVDKVTRGGQTPALHYVPDATGSGYSEMAAENRRTGTDPFSAKDWGFDPRRARKLLEEAGYPVVEAGRGRKAKGFPDLELLYNTSEGHRKIAVAIQDMFKRHLGITVALRNEEWKVMLKNLRDGHFQLARFGWTADYNHPRTFLDVFLSYSSQNNTRWRSPAFDAVMAQARKTPGRAASISLYRQAEQLALEGMSRIPLYFYTKSTMVKPYVRGFFPNALNEHAMRWVWIDPSWSLKTPGADNKPAITPRELPAPGRFMP